MPIPIYLAMTQLEFEGCDPLPEHVALLTGHFCPNTMQPKTMPPKSLLVLDDCTDSSLSCDEIENMYIQNDYLGILLDFQQPDLQENHSIITDLKHRNIPFTASIAYATENDTSVFLPPVPLTTAVVEYLSPWKNREIWLELALDGIIINVNPDGSQATYIPHVPKQLTGHCDHTLHCHYSIEVLEDAVTFTLWRTREDIMQLLKEAEALGIQGAVGLWQELK